MQAQIPLIVHLVHGTWPEGVWVSLKRRARRGLQYTPIQGEEFWFQTGHKFCKGLRDKLAEAGFAAQLRPFVWSGANSFAARAQAADEFAPHLVQGMRDGIRQLIVAHSHGGTLVMLAMRQIESGATPGTFDDGKTLRWMPGRSEAGNALDIPVEGIVELPAERVREGLADLEVVTLATPFLRVERYGSRRPLWSAFAMCFMIAFAALAIAVARRYGQDAAYPVMLVVGVVAGLVARAIGRSRARVERLILAPQALRFVGKRIQCIRGVADEAELSISAGILGCNVVRTLLVLAGNGLAKAVLTVVMAAYLVAVAILAMAAIADPGSQVVTWLYVFGAVALAVMMLLASASSLQSLLGVELAACGFDWLTTVESSPDADLHRIEIVTLASTQDTAEALRHAVYLHPQCVDSIAAGLRT